jgi:integrase
VETLGCRWPTTVEIGRSAGCVRTKRRTGVPTAARSRARKAATLDGSTPARPRHSYASGLVASGCDVVTVQRAVRHPSVTITLGVCSHLWPTAEDRTRAAAGDLMAAVLGARAESLRTETL